MGTYNFLINKDFEVLLIIKRIYKIETQRFEDIMPSLSSESYDN